MSDETRHKISEGRKRTILKQGELQNLKHRSYHYNDMLFNSSYELRYALYCEEHNINYVLHPKPIPYIFNGEQHLYFPDFYIPSEDKYVDPKNSYLINYPQKHLGISDTEKISIVSQQNNVNIEIIDGKHIACDMLKLDKIIQENDKSFKCRSSCKNKQPSKHCDSHKNKRSAIQESKDTNSLFKLRKRFIKLLNFRISSMLKESLGFTKEVRRIMSMKASGCRNSMFGKHWYTNGVVSIASTDCPEGFWPGRVVNKTNN